MKILFLTDWFLPHRGGARVYYHNLYNALVDGFGHQVTILTRKLTGWELFDREHSVKSYRIIRKGRPLKNWKWYQWLRLVPVLFHTLLLIRRIRPDAIHFGDLFPQGVVCLLLHRLLGFEYVGYCHGEEITQTDKRRYQPFVRNAIYKSAKTVIAASDFAYNNLARIGVCKERIVKINPGIDWQRFIDSEKDREAIIEQHNLQNCRVLLTVSRLCSHKGHALVIRALPRLLSDVPNLCYLIVGRGPEEERLKSLAIELGVAPAIRFAGYVPDEELPAYYATCDAFVMPSFEEPTTGNAEGFGMVFLEAGAAGKPVIAGASGGTAESVLENITGYRVDTRDTNELTERLLSLLADQDLTCRLGRRGLARVRNEFGWSERAALLEEILKRNAPTSSKNALEENSELQASGSHWSR
jgi:phosphatidylinositol alpha-1,6-mannosyltransferase